VTNSLAVGLFDLFAATFLLVVCLLDPVKRSRARWVFDVLLISLNYTFGVFLLTEHFT
jgi:hypothetical protein